MKKRLLAALLCVCIVLSMANAALAVSSVFTDVAADEWYTDEIKYVYEKGLMEGVGENKFSTDGTTSRAMVVTTLWRMEGEPASAPSNPFSDVEDGVWYTDAVIWAAENKIVEGYAGKFDPAADMDREQLATIFYRYAQFKDYDVSEGEDTNILSYGDALDVSEWAMDAMQWACAVGIIGGTPENNLEPQSDASRAELAVMLYRFCENAAAEEEEEEPTPSVPSVPSHSHSYTYEANEDGTHQKICSCGTTTEDCTYDWDECAACGYKDGNYYIDTAAELKAFRDAVNAGDDFSGKTVILMDDIDLNNEAWTPIGETADDGTHAFFQGTFDGNNNTISNLNVEDIKEDAGLFGYLGVATVKNVKLENVNITGNHSAGAIAGTAGYGAVIDNCSVKDVTIVLTPDYSESYTTSTKYDNGDDAGAIVGNLNGYQYADSSVLNCTAENVSIKGYRDLGGIVGTANADSYAINVTGCTVTGLDITVDQVTGFYGVKAINANNIVGRLIGSVDTADSEADDVTIEEKITVTNATEAKAALGYVHDNAVITLAAGEYDEFHVMFKHEMTAKNVTLVGENKATTILNGFEFYDSGEEATSVVVDGFTFKNLTFAKGLALDTYSMTDVTVENCDFNNDARVIQGNRAEAVTNLVIKDCTFTGKDNIAANNGTGVTLIMLENVTGLSVTGCTLTNCDYNAIQIGDAKGELSISGNTITGTGDRIFRFVTIKAGATMSISGNTITSEGDEGEMMKITTIEDGATVELTDNKWNSGTVNDDTLVESENGGKIWSMPVAKAGDTYYATLDAAVAAGGEVTLLKSINNQGLALNIPENANVTLDLNGYTFTSMDGGEGNNWAIKVDRGATFNLKDSAGEGKVVASCYGIYVQPGATFNLESGTIKVSGNGTYDFGVTVWNSTFNMTGGKIEAQVGVCTSDHYATTGGETGLPVSRVSVSAGTINIVGDYYPEIIYSVGEYTAAITGGTFSGTFTDSLTEYVASGYVAVETDGVWTVTAE